MQYRQGDVLITKVDEIAESNTKVSVPFEDGRVILAHGEATGHAHVIETEGEVLFRARDLKEMTDRFLTIEKEALVVHDEHDTITLEPGDYKITRQREYAPKQAPRPVYD
jgi:hypothetical protein